MQASMTPSLCSSYYTCSTCLKTWFGQWLSWTSLHWTLQSTNGHLTRLLENYTRPYITALTPRKHWHLGVCSQLWMLWWAKWKQVTIADHHAHFLAAEGQRLTLLISVGQKKKKRKIRRKTRRKIRGIKPRKPRRRSRVILTNQAQTHQSLTWSIPRRSVIMPKPWGPSKPPSFRCNHTTARCPAMISSSHTLTQVHQITWPIRWNYLTSLHSRSCWNLFL